MKRLTLIELMIIIICVSLFYNIKTYLVLKTFVISDFAIKSTVGVFAKSFTALNKGFMEIIKGMLLTILSVISLKNFVNFDCFFDFVAKTTKKAVIQNIIITFCITSLFYDIKTYLFLRDNLYLTKQSTLYRGLVGGLEIESMYMTYNYFLLYFIIFFIGYIIIKLLIKRHAQKVL